MAPEGKEIGARNYLGDKDANRSKYAGCKRHFE